MIKESPHEERIIAALSYLWALFFVPLIFKKGNTFCQFHAKQGLVLFIFSLLVLFFGTLPLIGWLIIAPLGWLVIIIFSVLGFLNTLQGKEWELPYLGKYAKKINL